MSGYGGSGGYEQNDERVSNVLSQETINRAIADDAARRQAPSHGQSAHSHSSHSQSAHSHSSQSHSSHSNNHGDVVPGITRRDTSTRRDPLTGDLIEDYTGTDANGPAMRAHHNWDEPGKSPFHSSSGNDSNAPRPGEVQRTNTIISYNASGDRVEDASGEGSLRVRAMYNEDDDTSNTYHSSGPPRGQSDGSHRDHY